MLERLLIWFLSWLAGGEMISEQERLSSSLRAGMRVAPHSGIIYFNVPCPSCGGNTRQHRREDGTGLVSWVCLR